VRWATKSALADSDDRLRTVERMMGLPRKSTPTKVFPMVNGPAFVGPRVAKSGVFCGGGCEEILECRFAPCKRRDDGQPHSPAPLDAFGGDGEIARRCHVVLPTRF
jgi:hypothetical protein